MSSSSPPFPVLKPSRLLDDADMLVTEYLTYRGFSSTLLQFAQDRKEDGLGGMSTKRLVQRLAQAIDMLQLKEVLTWWDESVTPMLTRVDDHTLATGRWLQDATYRLYLVECVKQNKMDLVVAFIKEQWPTRVFPTPFRNEWRRNWFALPFLTNTDKDRYFVTFFSSEWRTSLFQSLENFLSTVFLLFPPPRLLTLATARDEIASLRAEIAALRNTHHRSGMLPSSSPVAMHAVNTIPPNIAATATTTSSSSSFVVDGTVIARRQGIVHRTRFSPNYSLIAACGSDATASIWSSSSPDFEQLQTLFCGSTAFSLDWLSEDLLAVGTLDHIVRIWALRSTSSLPVSLKTGPLLPWILDITHDPSNTSCLAMSCAPAREALTASSLRFGGELQMWSVSHEKIDRILPVEPFSSGTFPTRFPTIKFNHNGSLLISAGSDGVVRVHDVRAGSNISGWRATNCNGGLTGLCLNNDETSIYTVGGDGEVIEWSMHRGGEMLRKFGDGGGNGSSSATKQPRVDIMTSVDGSKLVVAPHVFNTKTGDVMGNIPVTVTSMDWGVTTASSGGDAMLVMGDVTGIVCKTNY